MKCRYQDSHFFTQANAEDDTAKDLAFVMFETATLRSGYSVPDSAGFASRIEKMLRHAMNVDLDAKVSCSRRGSQRFVKY